MTEKLIQWGHERIGLLLGKQNHWSSLDRLFGFQIALKDHHLTFLNSLAVESEDNFPGGYTVVKGLLRQEYPPTVIFALSVETSAGALFAMNELTIKVPKQISLVSIGNMGISGQVWPVITAVQYPMEEIVEQSDNLLVNLVEKQDLPSKQIILPT